MSAILPTSTWCKYPKAESTSTVNHFESIKSIIMQIFHTVRPVTHFVALLIIFRCLMNILNANFCRKGVDVPVPRFDKNMEEFYSLCDQIELHLVSASLCFMELNFSVHVTQYGYCLLQSRYFLLPLSFCTVPKAWKDLTVTALSSCSCHYTFKIPKIKINFNLLFFIYLF